MSAESEPLWKRVWRAEGIRWLGPRGDGHADAMARFQQGFELGFSLSRSRLVEVLKEWRREWDETPHQHLLSEAFRQSSPESYSEQVADHLLVRLLTSSSDQEGGAA